MRDEVVDDFDDLASPAEIAEDVLTELEGALVGLRKLIDGLASEAELR